MSRSRARLPVGTLANSYASSNVGTVTPVQLSASLGQDVNLLHCFDTGANIANQSIILMIGPAGSEQEVLRITPGSDRDYPCLLNKGMRVSVLAAAGSTITTGELLISLYQ